MEKGLIFDFHRGTTHDGPGMRTTVFFKGCPLHCRWCHNPESINPGIELQWDRKKCIGCMTCMKSCAENALCGGGSGIEINREKCSKCYKCVQNCPAGAINAVGTYWEVEDLVKETCKDKMFFDDFEGGITVSGGEPVLQDSFLIRFLEALKAEKVNVALDTSGFGKGEVYEKVYPYVDIFLYDIKLMDEQEHLKYTGVSNKLILSNLKNLADMMRRTQDKRLWIRTPLIPGATATEDNIEEIGRFIKRELSDVVERWELCAFNNVCKEKYEKLNKDWYYQNTELMEEKQVRKLADIGKTYMGDIVAVSGLTRRE